MDTPPTNVPEYTVSEISGAVRRTLEDAFGRVRIRGEITGTKAYASGIYFCLKEDRDTLNAIAWKSAVSRLGLKPEDGVEVIATGRLTAYAQSGGSRYQLVVDRLEYAGVGALLARIERLRLRLAEEGLFAAEKKRPLPLLPAVVGVVTSPQGAVLHDICTTIARRFPRPILLWPVPVQGDAAAPRIAAAIKGFGRLPPDFPRPDVLIVGRGGGSLEDLMAFNDEAVVRAAALSPIPLIAAVGHETDHTLIDLAADRRAPTPTAAAELAVPARAELVARVTALAGRLVASLHRLAQEQRLRLGRAERGIPDLPALLGRARQTLDDREHRLRLALPNLLAARRTALTRAERGMPDLPGLLARARQTLDDRERRLRLALPHLLTTRRTALHRAERAFPDGRALIAPNRARAALAATKLDAARQRAADRRRTQAATTLARLNPAPLLATLREQRARLAGTAAQLESISPLAVLARGYVLVTDPAGHPVTEAAAIRPRMRLRLRFHDGEADATAGIGQLSLL